MRLTLLAHRRRLLLGVTLLTLLACAGVVAVACAGGSSGTIVFTGLSSLGVEPWAKTGGGAQCANYGTPSKSPRLRGDVSFQTVAAIPAAEFQLPPSQLPAFPLQACELLRQTSLGLGSDDYYGLAFYVPSGWQSGTTSARNSFWGITITQLHFQNIWGSPIEFELHPGHLTLALETGGCRNYLTPAPGCEWRSNADNPDGSPGNLGRFYLVPPPMHQGVWHEVIVHVHWAADSTGAIEGWTRVGGTGAWTQTVRMEGHPTVQWDDRTGCCYSGAVDKIGAYRGVAGTPVTVALGGMVVGTSFDVVQAALARL